MSKLETLFMFMLDGKEKTSLEISKAINTICAGTRIADLRKPGKGCHIISRFIRKTHSGQSIYGYTLLSFPKDLYGVGA